MTVPSNFSAIRGVPFKLLFLAPENVRKDESEDGIPELADDIESQGVLQNLAGYDAEPTRGKRQKPVGVVAGGRRYRALRLLLKQGRIDENYVVPCLVGSKDAAIAISLAENDNRKALIGHLANLSSISTGLRSYFLRESQYFNSVTCTGTLENTAQGEML